MEVSREFEFLIDSTTFELPNVRFSYEVSPPPPPPALLGATAALSLLDEEGFEKARSTMDSLLPTLQHTASSSVGGAVGAFLADEVVSQEQLTRAYLASYTYEKDSLAQRWVAAEHTGVWRKACASIVTLLLNNEELHANQDDLEYDRNMLAYVTAEASLALNLNDISVLNVWKLLCSHGGYRVPTYPSQYETYDFPVGTEVENFLPIVAYGSLHALRSQRLAKQDVCGKTFDRDLISGISCGRVAGVPASRFFRSEQALRAHFSPASLHKRYCDAMQTISVEDALSTPRLMSGFLTDSSSNRREGLDDLVASRLHRGQEDITSSYEELSLRGLVYVTYSHETRIRPGLHRLVDLQVFPSQGCAELPDARCSLFRTLGENPVDTATAFETGADMLLHTRCRTSMNAALGVTCPHSPYSGLTGCFNNDLLLSSNPQLYGTSYWYGMLRRSAPPPPPTSYTGPAYEYTVVAQNDRGAGSPNLNHQPWAATMGGCRDCADHQHTADCSTVAGALEACEMLCNFHDGECVGIYFYGSGHPTQTMGRCCPLGQMPSFPGTADTSNVFFYSKGPSTVAPSPPPHGPPSPPPTETYTEMLVRMRDAQELFCTSFNFQTTTDRCDQLAVSLGLRVRLLHSPPPSLPPPGAPQLIPPPPSTPPSPSFPRGTQLAPLASATLSTLRRPPVDPAASLELLEDGFAVEEAMDEVAFANLAFHQRARCTLELDAVDALPCVSSVQEDNCISSGRHCGTQEQNGNNPELLLTLAASPSTRARLPTTLRIHLPSRGELANLFFASLDTTVGGQGYEIALLNIDGAPIEMAAPTVTALPEERLLELPLQARSDEAYLRELTKLKHVRLRLPGRLRQIWLRKVEVVEVATELAAAPSLPPAASPPPSAPAVGCDARYGHAFDAAEIYAVYEEPCGLTMQQCCEVVHESHEQDALDLLLELAADVDDHGCCRALIVNAVEPVAFVGDGRRGPNAGVGLVSLS